jgi:DNA-binding CsgD family transcriptional regulator
MKKKGWAEGMEERAVEMYRTTSMHAGQVAQQLGASPWMVKQALRRAGVALTRGRREGSHWKHPFTAEQQMDLKTYYEMGLSTEVIAGRLGTSSSTVQRYLREMGILLRPAGFQQAEGHHAWKGGRVVTDSGYVLVLVRPDDPFYPMAQVKTTNARYCLEHRLVMAKHLGRLLSDDETVHHVDDRDRQNNDISNLQLRRGNHGKGAALRCDDCGSCNIVAEALS